MITFVCWKWKSPAYKKYRHEFTAEHVNVWADSFRRHYKAPHRLVCITDDPAGVEIETFPLWPDLSESANPSGKHLPSCYRRLKLFSSMVQSEMNIDPGSLVSWIDLDVVFVRNIRPMFEKFENNPSPFFGWMGVGAHNPTVYNGTLVMFRAGQVDALWNEFNPQTSPDLAIKSRYFGSDQGWISYKIAGRAPGWGTPDGILSYSRDVRSNQPLPPYARIVSFNGKMKPWDKETIRRSQWIRQHWRKGP